MKLCRFLLVLSFLCCTCAYGQFGGWKSLGKKALQKAQEKKEQPAPEKKSAEPTSPSATNPSPSTNSSAASTSPESTNAGGAASATPGSTTEAQPQLTAVGADFIPGERTVFLDDFMDMPPGEAPPHWKERGGAFVLRIGGGTREIYSQNGPRLTSPSIAFPASFTFELTFHGNANQDWYFQTKDDTNVLHVFVHCPGDNNDKVEVTVRRVQKGTSDEETLGESGDVDANLTMPNTIDLWAQQGRVRAYINDKPFVDANQVEFGGIDHIHMQAQSGYPIAIRRVRVAECAPDPGAMFATTGKYVTHGIFFDTDSDILKSESAPVIKEISTALYKSPSLKLEIDGFTDSTGDAAHNLDLSKRRAAAVASVLVSQFGIDQTRLTSKGFGASNPIASNDAADGRAQNRRVEFVKK
jgi:OmpA-OmpF porin, OOP family